MDKLKVWFSSLESREQIMVGFCAVFSVVTLGYFLLLKPAWSMVDEKAERVAGMRATLALIQENSGKANNPSTPSASGRPLVVVVEQSVQAASLKPFLKRNQPQDTSTVRVSLDNAPFQNVMSWLAKLGENERMFIQSAVITRGQQAGTVKANVTLVRAGA